MTEVVTIVTGRLRPVGTNPTLRLRRQSMTPMDFTSPAVNKRDFQNLGSTEE